MGICNNGDPSGSRRNHRRVRLPTSILLGILLLLYVQFCILPQYFLKATPTAVKLSKFHTDKLISGLQRCKEITAPKAQYPIPADFSRSNPRWNPASGQKASILLRNVTLFDGQSFVKGPVDILFAKGVIKSVMAASESIPGVESLEILDLEGRYVTPGLVDMHSHHLVQTWPDLVATSDGNEMNPDTGPLTPFVRALDSMKAYDFGTRIIASGGITSSLILPGSANIMGGEGFLVKNYLLGGKDGEEVVEELLLEHGIPKHERRRYMKMACGENPKRVYTHTRMGNAWIFRKQMSRAKDLLEKQDDWCLSAAAALESSDEVAIASLVGIESPVTAVEALELDSTVAMLRGTIGVNVHCYETEDFEDMLLHSHEFGFRIQALHHALSAWKIPELLKDQGQNITIATFSDFGLYKKEAYDTNVWAGKILSDHGVPVAYKSDHSEAELSAKYLMFQAATAHSFHLPEDLALQSVTSVPARSLEIDHRVGYAKPGYDADIVVWNSHPLSIGATPLQVYIDGKPTLDPKEVADTMPSAMFESTPDIYQPQMRFSPSPETKQDMCEKINSKGKDIVITGIKRSFMKSPSNNAAQVGDFTMIMNSGNVVCFGPSEECVSKTAGSSTIQLKNGHVLPGLIAVSTSLGLSEIDSEQETSDGTVIRKLDVLDPENVNYAKFGVHLDGKAFKRARYGGVTKAITSPITGGGILVGVSVGIKTSGKQNILNGGVFQDDVALHFVIGQADKRSESTPTVSGGISKLRKILLENKGKDSIYGRAANGTIPVVVHVQNHYDIIQLVKIKKEHGSLNLVIFGGAGAPAAADELAAARIPVILAPFRAGPDTWEKLDALVGPPLTKSSVTVLSEAGVKFALAIGYMGDSRIQNTIVEASWAAKYAGLSQSAAVDLVSRNVEEILGLGAGGATESAEGKGDFVIWEGNPLELGASVVVSVDGDEGQIMDCWSYTE